MKNTLLALLLLAGSSHAAISIVGTAATSLRDTSGNNAVANGTALLIVDVTDNGFLGMGDLPLNTTLTAANDPGFIQGGITPGSFFYDDLVLNTMTTSASGAVSGLLTNVSVANYLGMDFAIVWLLENGRFGIIRGADWTFPAADSGTYTFSATDSGDAATYYLMISNNPAAGTYNFRTATGVGGNSAAVFGAPEPSAAMLGALGALGLLRRRRSL